MTPPLTTLPTDAVQKFAQAMDALCLVPCPTTLAIAVSGGGDSMALAVLLHHWAVPRGIQLQAYTVDHALRPESAQEAENVGRQLQAFGMTHRVLTWQHATKPETHIQEKARKARYALLQEACRQDGIAVLAVAHNLEDQIETFWMRLSHGSGLDGLAGMAPLRDMEGIKLLRPLLDFTRQDLRDICTAAGLAWVEDPTNRNENFLRPRLRAFEAMLAAEGLTPQRLSQTIQKLAAARDVLSDITQKSVRDVCAFYPEGYATFHQKELCALPDEMARRVLAHVLRRIAPAEYPPGTHLVDRLYQALRQEDFAGQTAAGCDVQPLGGGQILIVREQAGITLREPLRANMCWDGRFQMTGPVESFADGWDIGPLGQAGIAALRKQFTADDPARAKLESLPGRVRASLPAVWGGEKILHVPHLSWISPQATPNLAGLVCRWHTDAAAQTDTAEIV